MSTKSSNQQTDCSGFQTACSSALVVNILRAEVDHTSRNVGKRAGIGGNQARHVHHGDQEVDQDDLCHHQVCKHHDRPAEQEREKEKEKETEKEKYKEKEKEKEKEKDKEKHIQKENREKEKREKEREE